MSRITAVEKVMESKTSGVYKYGLDWRRGEGALFATKLRYALKQKQVPEGAQNAVVQS